MKMTKKDFMLYIKELENFYNESLNDTEREIWYENLKFMSVERFNYILSELYKINKFMPKLSEVLDMHKQIPYTEKQEEVREHCEKCNDTGYVVFKKMVQGMPYEFAVLCTCGRQNNKDMLTIDDIGLKVETTMPSDEEVIRSMKKLKDSPIISEDIKNIIRENFRKRRINK